MSNPFLISCLFRVFRQHDDIVLVMVLEGGVTNRVLARTTMIWPLLLLLVWPLVMVVGVGVEPPSASNSMSMASSLLQTLSDNDFDDPDSTGGGMGGSSVNSGSGTVNNNNYRPEECRVKNLKQQQKMNMAKLDAHRCLIRDVVVQVPVPDTLIATYVHPSHVVVPRCTGKQASLFFNIWLDHKSDYSGVKT